MTTMDLSQEFIARSRYFLSVEYPAKIARCLDTLPADALWRRLGDDSNSVGNLLLHLAGNVRQWIVSGVGGADDHRFRSGEFTAREGESTERLWRSLRGTLDEADAVIAAQSASSLLERRTIQGRELSVLDAVYHVVEHFALHTGQIILLTKAYAPGRIQFYEDAGGLAIPKWRDAP
jgi:uncharacterized damage-inducible protein DinB